MRHCQENERWARDWEKNILQNTHLIKNRYPEHTKILKIHLENKLTKNLKIGQRFNSHLNKKDIQMGNKQMKRCFCFLCHQGNTDSNNSELFCTLTEWLKSRTDNTQLARMWSHRTSHSLWVGMRNGIATLENSFSTVHKIQHPLAINPAIMVFGIYQKDLSWKRMSTQTPAYGCLY